MSLFCKAGVCQLGNCWVDGECRYKSSAQERAEYLLHGAQEKIRTNPDVIPAINVKEVGPGDYIIIPPKTVERPATTLEDMSNIMETVFEECRKLRQAGQDEYAHKGQSAFANFIRAGKDLDLPKEKVLWIFAMKHRDGIAAYLKGHTSQREDVRGRINDLIVYLVLLRGMIDEQSNALTRPDGPHVLPSE